MSRPEPELEERSEPSRRRAFVGEVTDGELVLRALDDDEWAKEALFRRHVEPLTRLVTRLMARHRDAEDIVQDAFAKAWCDLGALRDPDSFAPWLRRIAVNRAKNAYRRRRLARALGLDAGVDDASLFALASHEASPEALTELRLVDAGLARLPTEQRIAWMLRHVQGEELSAVAAITGCSLATVKRRLQAADAALARHLGRTP